MKEIEICKSDVDVCLIVYNEELFLEDCLLRIRPSFERIVVLDMGSQDRTLEIVYDTFPARATIIKQPRQVLFEKGFAHARNTVTAATKKPWVLHIDADELLVPSASSRIKIKPSDNADMAAKVVRRNLVAGSAYDCDPKVLAAAETTSVEEHVRLYKPSSRIRWESFLHEEVWIDEREAHERASTADVVLDHVSAYRPIADRHQKECFYAWIMTHVFDNKALQAKMRSYYTDEYIPKNIERFREMARHFAGASAV